MVGVNPETWSVSLSVGAESRLPLSRNICVECEGVNAELSRGEDGLLQRVEFETERKYVPLLSKEGIVEPLDPARERLLSSAQNLEGIFGCIGLVRLRFEEAAWAWYCHPPEGCREVIFSYTSGWEASPVHIAPPDAGLISMLTRLALRKENRSDALSLNLFREAEFHFHEWRYIDAIRNYYLLLERTCADGKFKKTAAVSALAASAWFKSGVDEAWPVANAFIRRGDVSFDELKELLPAGNYAQIARWCFKLRSDLVHSSGKRTIDASFHPSNHLPFKGRAIAIRAVSCGVASCVLEHAISRTTRPIT